MLPDPILPIGDDVARQLTDFEKRLSHLERLEGGGLGLGARVFNSANILVANAVAVTLTFDSERFDTDNIHSVVLNTGRLTANTAGKYTICGGVHYAANAAGTREVWIQLNGGALIAVEGRDAVANGGASTFMTIACQWEFAINDFVELIAFQTSGGGLNVRATPNISPEFSMIKVG